MWRSLCGRRRQEITLSFIRLLSWSFLIVPLSQVHIQNSTLAGGVAVGACADILLEPYAAMISGCLVGLLSLIGFVYIQVNNATVLIQTSYIFKISKAELRIRLNLNVYWFQFILPLHFTFRNRWTLDFEFFFCFGSTWQLYWFPSWLKNLALYSRSKYPGVNKYFARALAF